jgi:hypothetical protein
MRGPSFPLTAVVTTAIASMVQLHCSVPLAVLVSAKPVTPMSWHALQLTHRSSYAVDPYMFGLTGRKRIAIVRECGAITGGSKEQEGQIRAGPLSERLKALAKDKSIAGIVLRVDSPGTPPMHSYTRQVNNRVHDWDVCSGNQSQK